VKLHLLAVGHRMPAWVATGFEDYARRFPRDTPLLLREIRPEPRGTAEPSPALVERLLRSEATRLRNALPAGAVAVALDERGEALTTRQFAQMLSRWLPEGRDLAFLVGGADGLDPEIKRSAQVVLSLSAMTLPHQLVRVLLAEQLYRAVSLLRNHPYHRD
jgi:23S rRNA (pseudouridine1915-N3)-methyltransferase